MRFLNLFKTTWDRFIGFKLTFLNILVLFISLAILSYLSFATSREIIKRTALSGNFKVQTSIANDINHRINQIKSDLDILISLPEDLPEEEKLKIYTFKMFELRTTFPLIYYSLHIFDNDGNELLNMEDSLDTLSGEPNLFNYVSQKKTTNKEIIKAFEEVRKLGTYTTTTGVSEIARIPKMIIGVQELADDESEGRILIAEIDSRDLWRKIDEVLINETGEAYIVSQDGVIIAHPNREYIGIPANEAILPVISDNEGTTEYRDPITEDLLLASFGPIGEQTGWGLVLTQEKKEVLSLTNIIGVLSITILVSSTVISGFVSLVLSQMIIDPLQQLTKDIEKIIETKDIEKAVTVPGQDEIGKLASSFNEMLTRLKEKIEELNVMNNAMIGRELRMKELKHKIKSLKKKVERFEAEI